MRKTHRPIFRTTALQRYAQSKEKIVLPRLLSPTLFRYLWTLLGLLMVGGLVVWLVIADSI